MFGVTIILVSVMMSRQMAHLVPASEAAGFKSWDDDDDDGFEAVFAEAFRGGRVDKEVTAVAVA